MGTYDHPPETKDITNIVTWSVDSQNLVTITNTSLVTATSICGSGNLTASYLRQSEPGHGFGVSYRRWLRATAGLRPGDFDG